MPFLERELDDWFADVDAGVINQNVDLAERPGHVALELAHLFLFRHIRLKNARLAAGVLHGAPDFIQLLDIARHQRDLRALSGQRQSHGFAQPLACARDHSYFSVQFLSAHVLSNG